MPAVTVTRDDVRTALANIDVEPGDILYVAAFMAALGNSPTIVDDTIDALLDAVGPTGTVVMPTFNFGFCHGEPFDPAKTSSTTGVLSEAFRKRPEARRTVDPPFHSVAALGAEAEAIASLRSPSSFGPESAFHWLWAHNAKQILLGCGYQQGVVHFHWLEELLQVPYRYWKQFRGQVRLGDGVEERAYYMYVRRLDIPCDWGENVEALGRELEAAGLVKEARLGYGKIKAFSLSDFYDFTAPRVRADKLVLAEKGGRPFYQPVDNPVLRLHHIGLVSKYAGKLEKFFKDIGYHIAYEGIVPEFNVNTTLYRGLNVMVEFVDPIADDNVVRGYLRRYPDHPIHHLAFEVEDFEKARAFFEQRGYVPVDGNVHKGPAQDQYVCFLSPVSFAGAIIELVFTDPGRRLDGGRG